MSLSLRPIGGLVRGEKPRLALSPHGCALDGDDLHARLLSLMVGLANDLDRLGTLSHLGLGLVAPKPDHSQRRSQQQ